MKKQDWYSNEYLNQKDDFDTLIGFEPISLMYNIFPIKL